VREPAARRCSVRVGAACRGDRVGRSLSAERAASSSSISWLSSRRRASIESTMSWVVLMSLILRTRAALARIVLKPPKVSRASQSSRTGS
jgi:hypothetical protein